jgi:hypothetical protein
MKAQELADGLNELARRMPRIVATLILQRIPIDMIELSKTSGFDVCGRLDMDNPRIFVTVNLDGGNRSSMNFLDLICGLCDDGYVIATINDEGRVTFTARQVP